jgi:hypothetical protein
MTQHQWINELMNEFMRNFINLTNVTLIEPLSKEKVIRALHESVRLTISSMCGAMTYDALGRASGDGWTTYYNTVMMIAYWKYTMKIAGITKYRLKAKGDDVIFRIEKKDMEALQRAIKINFTQTKDKQEHGLGQICKFVKYGPLTDLDFLSNHIFRNDIGKYRMARIPARILQTACWSTKVPKLTGDKLIESRKYLLFSKGKCLEAWATGLPIWDTLAKKMIALGEQGPITEYNQYSDKNRVWNKVVDDRQSYLQYLDSKYGIGSKQVEEIERAINKIDSLDGCIEIPHIELFYE